jgi:hypothetical protein
MRMDQDMHTIMNALHLETIIISITIFFLRIIVAEARNIILLQKLQFNQACTLEISVVQGQCCTVHIHVHTEDHTRTRTHTHFHIRLVFVVEVDALHVVSGEICSGIICRDTESSVGCSSRPIAVMYCAVLVSVMVFLSMWSNQLTQP